MNNETEKTIKELIVYQEKKLLELGRRIIPHLTADDLWQPIDFPELENHPEFRYEEGVLHGYLSLQMALRANKT
jgi:hypothetical protein